MVSTSFCTRKRSMNEITIRVVGIPAPQGSKTLTRWGAMIEASKKVKPWRTDVKEAALECYSSGALNLPVRAEMCSILGSIGAFGAGGGNTASTFFTPIASYMFLYI